MPSTVFRLYASLIRGLNNLAGGMSFVLVAKASLVWGVGFASALAVLLYGADPRAAATMILTQRTFPLPLLQALGVQKAAEPAPAPVDTKGKKKKK